MKDKLEKDLKKYEAEIASVNQKLTDTDKQRQDLLTHGRRIEGIVAYIRAALAPEILEKNANTDASADANKDEDEKEKAPTEAAAAPK